MRKTLLIGASSGSTTVSLTQSEVETSDKHYQQSIKFLISCDVGTSA